MQFPRSKFTTTNSLNQQIKHIQSELDEVEEGYYHPPVSFEAVAMELWDVIHSAETGLRILAEKNNVNVLALRDAVIEKNRARGYYGA